MIVEMGATATKKVCRINLRATCDADLELLTRLHKAFTLGLVIQIPAFEGDDFEYRCGSVDRDIKWHDKDPG